MTKSDIYEALEPQILAVLEGESNLTARMATVSCLVAQQFPDSFFWTGFYVVDPENPEQLVVGPYQGTLGCLRIDFGRGVCGTAAATGKTQVVDDVHAIQNHIACDSRTNSEIVVPVFDAAGKLIAVFDIDSTEKSTFDGVDAQYLERLMTKVFGVEAG